MYIQPGPPAQYAQVAQRGGTTGLSVQPAQAPSLVHRLCPYHLARTRGESAPLSRIACPTGPYAGSGLLRAQPSNVQSSCQQYLCAKSPRLSMSKRDETAPLQGKGAYRGSQKHRCSPRRRLTHGPSASPRGVSFSSPPVNTRGSSLRVVLFREKSHITYRRARVKKCVYIHIFELRALTLELDECLSCLAIVKPTHLAQLIPVHMAECVAARERLRVGHLHLFAAPLPRRRNPVALSRSPNSSSTIGDR